MRSFSVLLVGENLWLLKALCLLVESDPLLSVIGTSSLEDLPSKVRDLRPDALVFLPEVSLIGFRAALLQLRLECSPPWLFLITPVDATYYETTAPPTEVYEFISQSQINTHLIPSIRHYIIERQDTQHGS